MRPCSRRLASTRPATPRPARERRGGGDTPLRIIYVGNLLLLKGVHLGIEALAAADFPYHLTIVGDGIYRRCLERLVDRHGLREHIDFAGWIPFEEVSARLDAADVFLFASFTDSGGLALVEAMATGLPPVCLDCGGPGMAVSDDCGTAVPVGDPKSTVAALCEGFRRYWSDPELYCEHSAGAIKRVRRAL